MAITLWHVTRQSSAEQIEAGGFRDGPFRELARLRGVYFADRPMFDSQDGIPPGCVGFAVIFDDEAAIVEYEVVERGGVDGWREWFIPADVVNSCAIYSVKGG